MVGSTWFRIGLYQALGGATGRLVLSTQPPVGGVIPSDRVLDSMLVKSTGPGNGFATVHLVLDPYQFRQGQVVFAQWIINDPAAVGGESRSNVARIPMFCSSAGCPSVCLGDFNRDTTISVQDVFDFLESYFSGDPSADTDYSLTVSTNDIFAFLASYFSGCS